MEAEYYVLRTDKLAHPMYFAGMTNTRFGGAVGLCRTIFGAYEFESREQAQECMKDCDLSDQDFTISECGGGGMSANLQQPVGSA